MYKQYYKWSLDYMNNYGADPINAFQNLALKSGQGIIESVAKKAVQDAFTHYFRTIGVKIENVKIYWNE